jgi:hypothetical protein
MGEVRPLLACSLALLAAAASADTKLVYVEEGGEGVTAVLYVAAGRVRMDLPGAEDRWVLFDAAGPSLRSVDPARKTFSRLDAEEVSRLSARVAAANAQLEGELANVPPEQRAQVERVLGKVVIGASQPAYTRSGKRMKVNGWECEVVGYEIAAQRGEACLAGAKALALTEADVRALEQLRAFADRLSAEAFPMGMSEKLRLAPLEGLPVRAKHADEPAQIAKSVSHDTLPGSLFEVPAGYTLEPLKLPE